MFGFCDVSEKKELPYSYSKEKIEKITKLIRDKGKDSTSLGHW